MFYEIYNFIQWILYSDVLFRFRKYVKKINNLFWYIDKLYNFMISANKNIILVKNRMIVKLIDPCLAREVTSIYIYTEYKNNKLNYKDKFYYQISCYISLLKRILIRELFIRRTKHAWLLMWVVNSQYLTTVTFSQ